MDSRLELLVGKTNLEKIKDVNVLVVGLGGVGGYVVESLTRSFINSITIVDKDIVDISNINRQIIATTKTIGKSKVEAFENRIREINPSIKVYAYNMEITSSNIDTIFDKEYDYVIDCVDDIEAKISLIKECNKRNIKQVIATGTGKKLDASKLYITTLDKTSYDPLAKVLRYKLRKLGISTKIVCTASKEESVETTSNVIPSNSYVPSTAGLLITSYIINDIINKN